MEAPTCRATPKSVVSTRSVAELARIASTPEARDQFLSLQTTWIRLAMELDQARALIKATQELEEEQPIKAADVEKGARQANPWRANLLAMTAACRECKHPIIEIDNRGTRSPAA